MLRRRNVKERLGQYKEYEELFSRLEIELPLFGSLINSLSVDETEEKRIFEELEKTGYRKIESLRQIAERGYRRLRMPVLRYFENSDTTLCLLEMYAKFYSDLKERARDVIENSCVFKGNVYTTSEAAEYLGISPKKVRELLQPITIDGRPLRLGNEYIYRSDEVEELRKAIES